MKGFRSDQFLKIRPNFQTPEFILGSFLGRAENCSALMQTEIDSHNHDSHLLPLYQQWRFTGKTD